MTIDIFSFLLGGGITIVIVILAFLAGWFLNKIGKRIDDHKGSIEKLDRTISEFSIKMIESISINRKK